MDRNAPVKTFATVDIFDRLSRAGHPPRALVVVTKDDDAISWIRDFLEAHLPPASVRYAAGIPEIRIDTVDSAIARFESPLSIFRLVLILTAETWDESLQIGADPAVAITARELLDRAAGVPAWAGHLL
ncbi:hypothetical protein LG293_17900 (plasmid) [Citricoccus nitrophenolicus]